MHWPAGIALWNKGKTVAKALRLAPGTWFPVLSSLLLFICCPHDLVLQTVHLWILGNIATGRPSWARERTAFFQLLYVKSLEILGLFASPDLNTLSISINLALIAIWLTVSIFVLLICLLFPSSLEYKLHKRRYFVCSLRYPQHPGTVGSLVNVCWMN